MRGLFHIYVELYTLICRTMLQSNTVRQISNNNQIIEFQ